MKKRIHHIIYTLAGIFLLLLTVANAGAQEAVWRLEVDQCETMEFSVVDVPGDRYVWDIYKDTTVNFANTNGDVDADVYFEGGMDEGSTVYVNWLEPGTYMVRVMVYDEVMCTNNLKMFILDVIESKPEIVLEGDSVCIDEPVIVKIIFTGKGPWDVQYTYGDGTNVVNLNGIVEDELTIPITDPLPVGETTFWVISVEDDCKAYEYPIDERPNTGILIYPIPTNSKIYLKED